VRGRRGKDCQGVQKQGGVIRVPASQASHVASPFQPPRCVPPRSKQPAGRSCQAAFLPLAPCLTVHRLLLRTSSMRKQHPSMQLPPGVCPFPQRGGHRHRPAAGTAVGTNSASTMPPRYQASSVCFAAAKGVAKSNLWPTQTFCMRLPAQLLCPRLPHCHPVWSLLQRRTWLQLQTVYIQ